MSVFSAGLVLGQLAVLGPGGHAGTVTFSDRSEVRLRSAPLGESAIDLETVPVLTLGLVGRRTDLTLAYSPALSYVDIEDTRILTLTNSARLTTGWIASRRLRLTLGGEGTIGRQVSLGLRAPQGLAPPTPTPSPARPVATNAVLYTLTYNAFAGAGYQLAPRWQGQVSVAYGGGKGLDEVSRTLVPEYRGPTGQISVVYAASRQDDLTSRVRGLYVEGPDTGSASFGIDAGEIWRHTWTPRTSSTVGAGVAWVRQRPSRDAPYVSGLSPSGEASLAHVVPLGRAETLTLGALATVSVVYDPILASADPVVGTVASAIWAWPRFTVAAVAGTSVTIPTDPDRASARTASGSLTGAYSPVPEVTFEAGARVFVQDLPAPFAPSGAPPVEGTLDTGQDPQWALFLAVRFALPLARF